VRDHANESYRAVLSYGTVYFAIQGGFIGRFLFDQKFRLEFPEISMGEWYRLFRCGKRQTAQFRSLGIFQ